MSALIYACCIYLKSYNEAYFYVSGQIAFVNDIRCLTIRNDERIAFDGITLFVLPNCEINGLLFFVIVV